MYGMTGGNGPVGSNIRNNRNNRSVGVQQSIHPVIVISLEDLPITMQAPAITQSAAASFAQNQVMPTLQQAQVNVDGTGLATLRGTARNDHERALAAAMLSLEPGVRGVRNEMAVTPPGSSTGNR